MPFIDPIIATLAQICVALLLLGAAFAKLSDFAVFRATLAEYELVPGALVGIVAVLFAGSEIALGFAALVPETARVAAAGAAGLLSLYAFAIGINLLRGRRDIDCGCMGPANRQQLSGWLMLRNGVLVAVALLGAAPAIDRAMTYADWVVVGLGLIGAAALYAAANQLMANAPRLDALDAIMMDNA